MSTVPHSYYNDTTPIWDLSDDGYWYSDAWLYTGTNGAAVPPCQRQVRRKARFPSSRGRAFVIATHDVGRSRSAKPKKAGSVFGTGL